MLYGKILLFLVNNVFNNKLYIQYVYMNISTDVSVILFFFVHNDDVIKWKNFPRYWPFVRGIHRSPVNSSHKGQWRGALMLSLLCVWINSWVNNREAGDLRRFRAHYDVTVMKKKSRKYCRTRIEVSRLPANVNTLHGLVTLYYDIKLGQCGLSQWLVTWRHQTITRNILDWCGAVLI